MTIITALDLCVVVEYLNLPDYNTMVTKTRERNSFINMIISLGRNSVAYFL